MTIKDLYNDYIKNERNPLSIHSFTKRLYDWKNLIRERQWDRWFNDKTKEEKKEYFREKMRRMRAKENKIKIDIKRLIDWDINEEDIFTQEDFKYINSIPNYEQNTTIYSR